MTRSEAPHARLAALPSAAVPGPGRRKFAPIALLGAVAVLAAGCGGGAKKAEDKRVSDLSQQVAQLSQRVKMQDERIAKLGTGDTASPMAASTQSGPDNTVVVQCPPGAFLFRLPRTPSSGGEALCRPVAAPAGNEIKGH